MKTKTAACILSGALFCTPGMPQSGTPKKVLVVYFSRSGNTRAVAQQIRKAAGADIFELVPAESYPDDYRATLERARRENESGGKPALKSLPENLGQYDVIFVGSPDWYATVAPPVATFLSSEALAGKTLALFMTHGGSGLGRSMEDIRKLRPDARLLKALAVPGSRAADSGREVEAWLKDMNAAGD